MPELLDAALLGRLEQLQLGTRRRLAGRFAGEHRSSRRGTSLDFADYREYQRGDDPRRIDVGVWARLDQLLIRLYEAEDDLTVRLLVDTSASMAGEKLRQAARLAAALGFVALVRRDVVSVHTFPLDRPAPRFTGRHAAHAMLQMLDELEADGDTAFAHAVGGLLNRPGPPGLTVVVSDFLTAEWAEGLQRLPARGGDVTVLHVLDRTELHPELAGDLDLVDAETGEVLAVSLAPDQIAAYTAAAQAWLDDVAARAQFAGATYLRVFSDEPVEPLLLGSWRETGLLR